MKYIDTLSKNSSHAYVKDRLIMEWNHNRLNAAFAYAGKPLKYQAPLYNKPHTMYAGYDGQLAPVNPATGEVMVDLNGFVVDTRGNKVEYMHGTSGRQDPRMSYKNFYVNGAWTINGGLLSTITDEGVSWRNYIGSSGSSFIRFPTSAGGNGVVDGRTYTASALIKNPMTSSVTLSIFYCGQGSAPVTLAPGQKMVVSVTAPSKVTNGTVYRPIDIKMTAAGRILVRYPTVIYGDKFVGVFDGTSGATQTGGALTGYAFSTVNGYYTMASLKRYMHKADLNMVICDDGVSTVDENGREFKYTKDGFPLRVNDDDKLNTINITNIGTVVADENYSPIKRPNGTYIRLSDIDEVKFSRPVTAENMPLDSQGFVKPIPFSDGGEIAPYYKRHYDEELFPIGSLTSAHRPSKRGIKYAWASYSGNVNYLNTGQEIPESWATSGYHPGRFYAISDKVKYKYWISPFDSENTPHTAGAVYSNSLSSSVGFIGANANLSAVGGKTRVTSTRPGSLYAIRNAPTNKIPVIGGVAHQVKYTVTAKSACTLTISVAQFSNPDSNFNRTPEQGFIGVSTIGSMRVSAGQTVNLANAVVLHSATQAVQVSVTVYGAASGDYFDVSNFSMRPVGFNLQNTRPVVKYIQPVKSNKILFGVDYTLSAYRMTWIESANSIPYYHRAEPIEGSVEIFYDRGDGVMYKKILPLPELDENGKGIYYIDGIKDSQGYTTNIKYSKSDEDTTPYLKEGTGVNVMMIAYNVRKMSEPGVRLSINEISARLEYDMTQYLASWTTSMDMSEPSFVAPFGRISSNSGSIELDNSEGRFSNNNLTLNQFDSRGVWQSTNNPNPYFSLIGPGIKITVDASLTENYNDTPVEWERMITMETTSDWSAEDTVAKASLRDGSFYLQNIKPNKTFATVGAYRSNQLSAVDCVRFLLDGIGFTSVEIPKSLQDVSIPMKFFWTNGESTVWQALDQLCEHLQIAAYFDNYNILRLKTIDSLKKDATNKVPSGIVTTEDLSNKYGERIYANAEEPRVGNKFDVNRVEIRYKETGSSKVTNGIPEMQEVWTPDGTVVLRSSEIVRSITKDAKTGYISERDAKDWPYSGEFQVDSETIEYDGKGYLYYKADGSLAHTKVRSVEFQEYLDTLNKSLAYKNRYSGCLYFTKRGSRHTWPANHLVDKTVPVQVRTGGGGVYSSNKPLTNDYSYGCMDLVGGSNYREDTYQTWWIGNKDNPDPRLVATRFSFRNGPYKHGSGGLFVGMGPEQSGIFIELNTTNYCSATKRTAFNEISVVTKHRDGTIRRYGEGVNRRHGGQVIAVPTGKYIELAVLISRQSDGYVFSCFVNNSLVMNTKLTNDRLPYRNNGRIGGIYGLYERGYTKTSFDYFFVTTALTRETFQDDIEMMQKVSGGLAPLRPLLQQYGRNPTMREFVPIAHEVRDFNVDFKDTVPSEHSSLFMSSPSAVINEYRHSPFGASFRLTNASRYYAVLNGEDTVMFGPDDPVQQRLLIYGRQLKIGEDNSIVSSNGLEIAMNGEKSLEIDSPWVQSKEAAAKLAKNITDSWKDGTSDFTVDVFPNLRWRLGNVVSVYMPDKGIGENLVQPRVEDVYANNRYVINNIKWSRDEKGLSLEIGARALINDKDGAKAMTTDSYDVRGNRVYNPNMLLQDGRSPRGWDVGASLVASNRANALLVSGKYDIATRPAQVSWDSTITVPFMEEDQTRYWITTQAKGIMGRANVTCASTIDYSRGCYVSWVMDLRTRDGVKIRDMARQTVKLRPGESFDMLTGTTDMTSAAGNYLHSYFVIFDADTRTAIKQTGVIIDDVSIVVASGV